MKRRIAQWERRRGAATLVRAAAVAVLVLAGGSASPTQAADVARTPETETDNSYYGDVVLDDDGSFAAEPDLAPNATGNSSGAGQGALSLAPTARQNGETVRFQVATGGVKSFAVLVADATGRTVFSGSTQAGGTVEWNLQASARRPARGLYYYRIFAHGTNGGVAASAPGRLMVR